MANSAYSYADILAGRGSWKYESPASDSTGVEQMQRELNSIGYACGVDGYFGRETERAVTDFQRNIRGLSVDSIVGTNTLKVLNSVKGVKYFNDHGKPIPASDWTVAKIKGYTPRNVLSRVIYAEDTGNTLGQQGVACVIKNRAGTTTYRDTSVSNPYVGVVVKTDQYSTVDGINDENACVPMRGDFNATGYINALWRSAVDLAEKVVNGQSIPYPTGNAVSGKAVQKNAYCAITTGHYRQVGKIKYFGYVDEGKAMAQVLTFESDFSGSANVFFLT